MARSSGRRRVAELLHSAAIHVLRYARDADRRSGVGSGQLSALSVLRYGGRRSIGELAAAEYVTPPTMTRIVHALEKRGYVRLTRAPKDARVTMVDISPSGAKILERARQARLDRIEALLARARPQEVLALGKALDALLRD